MELVWGLEARVLGRVCAGGGAVVGMGDFVSDIFVVKLLDSNCGVFVGWLRL